MRIRFLSAVVLSFLMAASAVRAQSREEIPTLYAIGKTALQSYGRGAQKAWPISVDEDGAFAAIFRGGMWLPSPDGSRQFIRYDHHVVHQQGDWTFFGKVQTARGEQSAIITFGKSVVFGYIPQKHGQALRITSNGHQTLLVQTAVTMERSPFAENLEATPDFGMPPHAGPPASGRSGSAAQLVEEQADTSATVDLMVAYTPGFVSEYGSQSAALARIDYVVDVANQAYADSGVSGRVNLVHTVEVNYPDNTYDPDAVSDLTGISITTGQPVPVPASLSQIHSLREQYHADLVSMIRKYDDATNGYCGFAWIIGADQSPIVPSSDYAYGYSVVGDGSDNGYYCYDQGLAHELGHNMGSVHDHAHPSLDNHGNPITGAYPYSYGYAGGSSPGFFTIMAYGSGTQTPAGVFSSPNISSCQGQPCGVANQEDNARSLNQTMPLIAQFESTPMPPFLASTHVHNDVTGSGNSDLLWYNPQASEVTYWVMNGPTITSWQGFTVPSGYQPIATGDFDGNGGADILWKTASSLYVWLSDGSSFSSQYVGAYPAGWTLAGAGDVNGDGDTDLFWYNSSTGQLTYWLMDGATVQQWRAFATSKALLPLATGDFDGSGRTDIVWKTADGSMYMWLFNSSGSFNYYNMGAYPTGWTLAGTGDVNGDGKTDLFWYNPAAGQVTYWLMNGAKLTSWKAFATSPGLQPLASGKFDATHAGLTWNQSGAMYMWLLSGSSFQYYSLGTYPSGWEAIP